MKPIYCIITCLIIFGCRPEINNNQIIADKYIEGFYQTKHFFTNNKNVKNDKQLLPLIDSIIIQTKTQKIQTDLRQAILAELDKIPSPKFEEEQSLFDNLKLRSNNFRKSRNAFIEDLNFIELFLEQKIGQHWSCNMGSYKTQTLLTFDTLLLKADREYELPIRIEYNGLPSSVSIISNSIQGSQPNIIKFKTQNESNKFQIVHYQCEAINKTTGAIMNYRDKIVIQLMKNDG